MAIRWAIGGNEGEVLISSRRIWDGPNANDLLGHCESCPWRNAMLVCVNWSSCPVHKIQMDIHYCRRYAIRKSMFNSKWTDTHAWIYYIHGRHVQSSLVSWITIDSHSYCRLHFDSGWRWSIPCIASQWVISSAKDKMLWRFLLWRAIEITVLIIGAQRKIYLSDQPFHRPHADKMTSETKSGPSVWKVPHVWWISTGP